MQQSPYLVNMVISSIILSEAFWSVSASDKFNRIEETEIWRSGTGSLNPLWTVLAPFNSVAAIPVVSNGSAISPRPLINAGTVEYK